MHDRRMPAGAARLARTMTSGSDAGIRLATVDRPLRSAVCLVVLLALRAAHAAPATVVRAGDASPLGLPFSSFSYPVVDDRGQVAFVGASAVVFTRSAAGLVHRVGAGDVLQGRVVAGVGAPALGTNGCLAVRAGLGGGGAGILRQCAGAFELIAETGGPTPGGRTFAGFTNDVAIGATGRIAFTGVLDDRSTALFVADAPGTFTEVVRTGTASPAGGTFSSLRALGVSSSGRVGFRGLTSDGPDGLFVWDGAAVSKLVVVGDASPAGGAFTAIGLGAMNDAEVWTFRAAVSNGPRTGVFRASTSAPVPAIASVALDGEPTPVGGTFRQFPTSLVPAINAAGAIAFRALVADADFSAGIFVARPDGTLRRIVAVGETTDVGVLVRLREITLADDESVIVRASLAGGTSGLFRAASAGVETVAVVGDTTDLGASFRFSDASVRDRAENAVFLGTREGLFTSDEPGATREVARLGDPTPLGGQYTRFDLPAGGPGGRIVFGIGIQGGRVRQALLAARGRRPPVLVRSGQKIRGGATVVDLFASPLDELARAAVGPGAVAFQAGLSGHAGASGIVLWSGGRLRAIARDGQAAPGGGRYLQFGTPAVGAGDRVAFVARVGESNTTLFQSAGGGTRALAMWGARTGTRIPGVFRAFDTPAAAGVSVAFRAVLDQSREAVFLARGPCRMALAGTGETAPGGGRFTRFGPPTFAGGKVVFRASIFGGPAAMALYRAIPAGPCTRIPPALDPVATADASSPFLDLGPPAGNPRGALVFTADLSGSGPTDTILFLAP